MKKVFKYPVEVNDIITVDMPEGAHPLRFDTQGDQIFLWALVDPTKKLEPFKFIMAGTGHEIQTCGPYINTMFMRGGALVFHFFYA